MKSYLRVTLGYFAFGVAWILISDQVVELFTADIRALSWFQTVKGACYVLASSVLIWALCRQSHRRMLAEQAQREQVFRKTIEASHHILLNYLNKMQVVTLEAESCPGFDPATLRLGRDASAAAAAELGKLEEIRTVTAEHIDSVVYRELREK
jgi:hypothetical protein